MPLEHLRDSEPLYGLANAGFKPTGAEHGREPKPGGQTKLNRIVKFTLWAAVVSILALVSFAFVLLGRGYSQFPADVTAADPASVPPVVLDGFSDHLAPNYDVFAARLFLHRDGRDISQRGFLVASATAHLWILTLWSPAERLTEIAQQGYFGHGFRGVENAARGYFGRPAQLLSPEEVAALALLTHSPLYLSPWCNRDAFNQRAANVPSFAKIEASQMLRDLLPPPEGSCKPPVNVVLGADVE